MWHRFSAAAFESKTHQQTNPKYDIIVFRTLRHFEDVDEAIRIGKRDRTREADQIPSAGSGLVLTVEPSKKREGFTVRQSGVLLVNRGTFIPEFDEATEVFRLEVSNREVMSQNIGTVARYPEGYMRESAERAMEVLEATKGLVQCSFRGTMYRKT
jgi:hypothetical protein